VNSSLNNFYQSQPRKHPQSRGGAD